MHLAVQALENLPISGMFIVGTQDIRAENGKLTPLAMLVLEDVIRVVGDDCLKLKELSKSLQTLHLLTKMNHLSLAN